MSIGAAGVCTSCGAFCRLIKTCHKAHLRPTAWHRTIGSVDIGSIRQVFNCDEILTSFTQRCGWVGQAGIDNRETRQLVGVACT